MRIALGGCDWCESVDGEREFCLKIEPDGVVLSFSLKATRDAWLQALDGQRILSIKSSETTTSGTSGLDDDVMDLTDVLFAAKDDGGGEEDGELSVILETRQSYVKSYSGAAFEAASALAPGLLELASDLPVLGPLAGILLKCHAAYTTMGENQEALSGLDESIKLAATIILKVSQNMKQLENDESVLAKCRELIFVCHRTTLLIHRLQKHNVAMRAILSKKNREAIASAVGAVRNASDDFRHVLSVVTDLKQLGSTLRVEEKVDHIMELLEAASRRTKQQEALYVSKRNELDCIHSSKELTLQSCVGVGGEGSVFEGKFQNKMVAIKILSSKTKFPALKNLTKGGMCV